MKMLFKEKNFIQHKEQTIKYQIAKKETQSIKQIVIQPYIQKEVQHVKETIFN